MPELMRQHQPWIPVNARQVIPNKSVPLRRLSVNKHAKRSQDTANGKSKKQKSEEKKNNAVYVTSLPEDTTEDELHDVFSKFGVIAESADSDKPRIKLYADEKGNFKGDALIGRFKHRLSYIAELILCV